MVWIISGGLHLPSSEDFARYGYGHFFGHWDFNLLAKNVFYIDLIILPTVALALYASYRGVSAMWKMMAENTGVGQPLYRPSASQFIKEFLWPAIVEIVQHTRFKECKTNADRLKGHLPLLLSFLALFFVTVYSAFTQDVIGIFVPSMHGPMSMWNPVKILANVAAIAEAAGKTAAELVETLKGEGPFTVFAPTEDAFKALPEGTLASLLLPENKQKLTDILLYHVVSGSVLAEDVVKLDMADTVLGQSVTIKVDMGKVYINDAQVIVTDIKTTNGIIHVINAVILPQ